MEVQSNDFDDLSDSTTRKCLAGVPFSQVHCAVSAELQAGYFANIAIDDQYDDWTGVPVADSDAGDNFGGPDIGDTQIANDDKYLYIRNTFPNSLQLSTYIGVDADQNPGSGFNIFGLGIIGSEAGWQNDFGFSQSAGVFNSGPLIGADFFGAGHALLSPFGNFPQREMAISLANANNGSLPTFPSNTIQIVNLQRHRIGRRRFAGRLSRRLWAQRGYIGCD